MPGGPRAWRRRASWLALPIAGLVLAACGGDGSTAPDGGQPPDTQTWARPAIIGADVSALARIEQAGGVFRIDGQAGDALSILRGRGANLFRLRVFVNPNHQEVQVNDLAYTIDLARRVKATGAKLLLDFHYSDTWADPGHQVMPAGWDTLGFDALVQKVRSYTTDVVAQLTAAGARPDIVQIGNEIDSGMLWPAGQVGGAADNATQWTRLASLIRAGIDGVRTGAGPGDSVRIMLQYSQGGSSSGTQWFLDRMATYGVPWDILGLSYYPWWHGTLAQLRANLQATAARYGRDIMVVETSYPWRAGGWEDMATDRSAMTWAVSTDGQTAFMRDVLDAVATTSGGHGIGVVWWYPEAIQVPGVYIWGGGSLSLFDASGNVLPATTAWSAK